jgi:hypothetical protein
MVPKVNKFWVEKNKGKYRVYRHAERHYFSAE